jgi:hypothetical protein
MNMELHDSSHLYRQRGAQKPLLDLCTRNPLGEKRSNPIPTFCCSVAVPLFDFPVRKCPIPG